MIKKMEWNWEKLDENTYRAKAMGGWIIKCIEGKSIACTFVVDRDLEWHIIQPRPELQVIAKNLAKDFEAK